MNKLSELRLWVNDKIIKLDNKPTIIMDDDDIVFDNGYRKALCDVRKELNRIEGKTKGIYKSKKAEKVYKIIKNHLTEEKK